ncbi:MAG: hypothetical protein R3286_09255 [Gammaproteobacteria bacterium]|nr:hypothetical protein [Gammaproteobacteria bacterium]
MSGEDITRLPELVNGDAWLVHRGRFLDVTFLVEVGDDAYLVRIRAGRIDAVERSRSVMPRWTFALRASKEAWSTFWQPAPPPGYHDLVAMMKFRHLRLEGDQYPFMTHIRYFKDVLGRLRARGPGADS